MGGFGDDIGKQAYGLLSGVWPGAVGAPPTRGARERLAAYADAPWLHAVADKVTSALAAVEWQAKVVRTGPPLADGRRAAVRGTALQCAPAARRRVALARLKQAGELDELEESPFLDLMAAGNVMMTGLDVRRITFLHRYVEGEAFWVKERDALGTFFRAWPVPPPWVRAMPTPSRPTFLVGFRGWQGQIPDTEMVWFSKQAPENPYGRGTGLARALADELETDQYAASLQRMVFLNGARPDFVVFPKNGATWTPTQVKQMESDWRRQHEGFWRCHDEETEALTRRGWVRGLDLHKEDEIATWNDADQCLEYQRATAHHSYNHCGVMYHWSGHLIDAMVTPNHRLWYKPALASSWRYEESTALWQRGGPIAMRVAGVAAGNSVKAAVIPSVVWSRIGRPPRGIGQELVFDAHDLAPVIGYIATEGSVESSRIRIGQTGQNARKRLIVEAISASLSIFPSGCVSVAAKGPNEWEWTIAHKGFAIWAAEHIGIGARNKHLPVEVFQWPTTAKRLLLAALIQGDGDSARSRRPHQAPGTAKTFWTISNALADDIQRLAVEVGWRARKIRATSRTPSGPLRHWRVSMCDTPFLSLQRARGTGWATPVPYQGVVWCTSMPNGNMFTRRNGCVLLSGNSFKARFSQTELGIQEFKEASFRNLQMEALRKFSRDTVFQVAGVPPELFGALESSNRATIDASETLFAHWVLRPELESFRATLQERVAPEFDERLIVDYAFDDVTDKAFVQAMAATAPWSRKMDEWRSAQGLDPLGPEAGGELFPVGSMSFEADLEESEGFSGNPFLQPAETLPDPGDEGDEDDGDEDEEERAVLRRLLPRRRRVRRDPRGRYLR